MTILRSIDGTPPAIQPHHAEQEQTETWNELDAWLDGRMIHANSYLDGEVAQSSGWESQVKHRARLEAYAEVRRKIAHICAVERDERGWTSDAESVEAAFKDAYGDGPDGVMAQIQAEDR